MNERQMNLCVSVLKSVNEIGKIYKHCFKKIERHMSNNETC